MKVVHLFTYMGGGAGRAAIRLHSALKDRDVESRCLFLEKGEETNDVYRFVKRIYIFQLALRVLKKMGIPIGIEQSNDYRIRKYKRKFELFSFAKTQYTRLFENKLINECDIVHMHFVSNFVDYGTFFKAIKKPIVWTLHDMNPFQGGFHYKNDEIKFAEKLNGLDEQQYQLKAKALKSLDNESLTVVGPSKWIMNNSKQSKLLGRFKHAHIPNGIDTSIFKIRNKKECRIDLGILSEKSIILFVAESVSNHRKGFDRILDLVEDKRLRDAYLFVAVGDVRSSDQNDAILYLGSINDEYKMSLAYNAASIFLLPSREDNLPNTMIESLCCGTPVVSYAVGGISETIHDGENGFLCKDNTVEALLQVLTNNCLENDHKWNNLAIAKNAQEKYSSNIQAEKYLELYKNLV